jgi:hypothetical protein
MNNYQGGYRGGPLEGIIQFLAVIGLFTILGLGMTIGLMLK